MIHNAPANIHHMCIIKELQEKPDKDKTPTLNCIHISVNKFPKYGKQNRLPYK